MEGLESKPIRNKIVQMVIPMREKVFIHRALWGLEYQSGISAGIRDLVERYIQGFENPPFVDVSLEELQAFANIPTYLCFLVSENEKNRIREAKKFKAKSEQGFILRVLREALYYRLDENKDVVRVRPESDGGKI